MAETLGSLCDKLTIVKLKEWHTEDPARLSSLSQQSTQLEEEIDEFVASATSGATPISKLSFAANKVVGKFSAQLPTLKGSIGEVFAELARVNCELWHQQERVYHFETVPDGEKDVLVRALGELNLQRNHCIDGIDRTFSSMIAVLRAKQ